MATQNIGVVWIAVALLMSPLVCATCHGTTETCAIYYALPAFYGPRFLPRMKPVSLCVHQWHGTRQCPLWWLDMLEHMEAHGIDLIREWLYYCEWLYF